MKHTRSFLLTFSIVVMFVAAPALADWFPGDPYKMLNPQLPDPQGWDVLGTYPKVLADDWMWSQTGPVDDVHLWGSWEGGQEGILTGVHLSIHADIPVDPDGPTGFEHSRPGELLWYGDFDQSQFTVIPYGEGDQGWYDPNFNEFIWRRPDHTKFHQINITHIPQPFIQQEGTIYWLDVSVMTVEGTWGWKTSLNHWNDAAVWGDFPVTGGPVPEWFELRDPFTQDALDMAFVITPEPATMLLLAAGGAALILRRKKRRK